MFKNYFKTAWRSLSKNKIFSIVNITGLSINYQSGYQPSFRISDKIKS